MKEILLYFYFNKIFILLNRKISKFSLRHDGMALALFGLILLSVIPTMFGTPQIDIVQPAAGQGEDPFPATGNETLTPAQQSAREELLKEKGFSVNAITRNLSAPLNILYGPDHTLWITER